MKKPLNSPQFVDVSCLNELFLDLVIKAVKRGDLVALRQMDVDSATYKRLKSMSSRDRRRLLLVAGDTLLFKMNFRELLAETGEQHKNE